MSVEELSLSERQACCIARAIVRQPKVLILDEATSALDIATRDNLFEIVRVLCRKGVGVIFITHRMDEISEIGDRITVLRSGTTVGTLERGSWTTRELVHLMTGADQLIDDARPASDAQTSRRGKPVLSVKNLQLHLESKPFDAEIHTGELVGVAGLEGHGQEAFLDALRGSVMVKGQTLRHEDGRDIAVRAPSEAARLGIVYVPRERRQSLFGWMSIRENFGMPTLPRDTVPRNSRVTWLRPRETRRRFAAYVDRLGIVLGRQDDRITTLSGGNQQKVVIARWLAASPRLLILNDPTRGIDIGAKRDLYRLLTQLVSEGMAVVMLSTELDEHIELMDRVLVFRDHELYREIDRSELSRHVLLSAFFGQVDAQEHTS
jgi:ABC-type sugar transport system ATPase subunit